MASMVMKFSAKPLIVVCIVKLVTRVVGTLIVALPLLVVLLRPS